MQLFDGTEEGKNVTTMKGLQTNISRKTDNFFTLCSYIFLECYKQSTTKLFIRLVCAEWTQPGSINIC